MKDNYRQVRIILWIILAANLTVAAVKILLGAMINSASMTADGFHSLTDGSSNVVGLIGIYFASKPEDKDHPYGHKKYEMLAGLFIGGMLFVVCGRIIVEAIGRLRSPVVPDVTVGSLVLLLITLLINIFVCVFEYRKGKRLGSPILVSDSMHTRSDIYISAGVMVTLVLTRLGVHPVIDPIASFVVAGFIIHAAYKIIKGNSGVLLDKSLVDTEKIREIVLNYKQVKDIHNIRSRGIENDLHIDMHIMTEPDLSVKDSHELIHGIEERLRKEINGNIHLIAHLEPFSEGMEHCT